MLWKGMAWGRVQEDCWPGFQLLSCRTITLQYIKLFVTNHKPGASIPCSGSNACYGTPEAFLEHFGIDGQFLILVIHRKFTDPLRGHSSQRSVRE